MNWSLNPVHSLWSLILLYPLALSPSFSPSLSHSLSLSFSLQKPQRSLWNRNTSRRSNRNPSIPRAMKTISMLRDTDCVCVCVCVCMCLCCVILGICKMVKVFVCTIFVHVCTFSGHVRMFVSNLCVCVCVCVHKTKRFCSVLYILTVCVRACVCLHRTRVLWYRIWTPECAGKERVGKPAWLKLLPALEEKRKYHSGREILCVCVKHHCHC